MEYDRYNNLLKHELPHLLDLRSSLLKPGIQTLLAFQKVFYSKSSEIFSSRVLAAVVTKGGLERTGDKFEREINPIMMEIRSMGMFHGSGLICTIIYHIFIFLFISYIHILSFISILSFIIYIYHFIYIILFSLQYLTSPSIQSHPLAISPPSIQSSSFNFK